MNYTFEGDQIMNLLINSFHRYEVYLRKAITQFMNDLGHAYGKERYFQVGFFNLPQVNKIRDLKVMALGRLMSIHGTVTRTTEVKPELLLGTFKCEECGTFTPSIE
jgi:DNA replication licensing factor MCM6